MFLQEGINLFLCRQQNSVCVFNGDKAIVNIDAFISHVLGNEREEGREDVAFVGRGRWF